MAVERRVSARQAAHAKPEILKPVSEPVIKKKVSAARSASQSAGTKSDQKKSIAKAKPTSKKAQKTAIVDGIPVAAEPEIAAAGGSRRTRKDAEKDEPQELASQSTKGGKPTKSTKSPKSDFTDRIDTKKLKKATVKRSRPSEGDTATEPDSKSPPKKRARKAAESHEVKDEDPDSTTQTPVKKEKKPRKPKANPYGFTPGETPFPDHVAPTVEQCQTVTDLLSTIHGNIQAPKEIPAPSLTVSGCGEVPSILDALIRTLLSAATTGKNSSNAFQGLVKTFGLIDTGIGKGSVNWNKVRLASQPEVFEAIKCGGLAANKSKNIKAILDRVYEENQERAAALVKAEQDADSNAADKGPSGAKSESEGDKNLEVYRAEHEILSLDHLHALSRDEAMLSMMKYPGIGMKTSSCVALFCMQRPSFAVDTHVWRMCKWLGWVPEGASRDETYRHCEVRVPDEQKYALHQLFIKHGKTCPRCRAITGENSEGWDEGCVIDHLVTRTGPRKGPATPKATPKKGGKEGGTKKRKKAVKDEDEDEDSDEEHEELDLDSDDDSDYGKKGKGSSKKPTPVKKQQTQKQTPQKATKKAVKMARVKKEEKVKTEDEEAEEASASSPGEEENPEELMHGMKVPT